MEAGARAAPEKEILDRVKLEWLATHAREAATDDGGDRVALDRRRARAKEIAPGDGWEAQIRASTSVVERPRADPRSKPRASHHRRSILMAVTSPSLPVTSEVRVGRDRHMIK